MFIPKFQIIINDLKFLLMRYQARKNRLWRIFMSGILQSEIK